MKVTVFGMGYVGCVTAACLAEHGHDVTGIDPDDTKTHLVNEGKSPIIEPGLEEIIRRSVDQNRLRALPKAVSLGDLAIVCVGTPSNDNGSLGLEQMARVLSDIGKLIAMDSSYIVVNIRSTVIPGTVQEIIIPALEKESGKQCGRDFGVCMNPEFMRETTAVRDFEDPPFTVIGTSDEKCANRVRGLYDKVKAPLEITSIREAEMIKYACNAFHALKVCFANEIGNLGKQFGVDSHNVMRILCTDDKLNLSPYYMKPGFAFGGSCLPKDLRAILHKARQLDIEVPMLSSLLTSNRGQIDIALKMIKRTGKLRVGVLGLSFKAGTDDLRESPIVALIEQLIGKGYAVKIYDEEVSLARLYGANRRYIEHTIPHISSLMMASIEQVIEHAEVVVVAKKTAAFSNALTNQSGAAIVLDLVRLWPSGKNNLSRYEGICW